jgi:hypothetical protein
MLEIDINRKTGVGVRMLSINFMHPPSLLTWLEMRRMIFDVGKRFFLRMQMDLIAFMILVGGQIVMLAMLVLGYLYLHPLMKFWHMVSIFLQVLYLMSYNWPTIQAAAKTNETTTSQLRKLISIRHLI